FKFGFTFAELGKTWIQYCKFILKNIANTFITLMAYWLHGYAFAFGEGSDFIGTKYFFTLGSPNLCHFFFNYAQCAVATTAALRAVIERTEPIGYLISSHVFPNCGPRPKDLPRHSPGLTTLYSPPQDCGGSRVVFLVGGTVALVACYIIGITAPGEGRLAALCVLNILLAGASSGRYGLILQCLLKSYYNVDCFINTTIAGLVCMCTYSLATSVSVSVCAEANSYIPRISVMCGATSSFFYFIMDWLVLRNKIDDPLHVISIYLGSGVSGLIFAGFFSAQGTLGGTDK
ncbi:LOW QUALITY PROTEIN: ammonium transporter 2-like, partial [Polyodon spathula]|uniref:LOW QUALITY PROTEIN: ammonium transporter 2-like n=1 Tax=Polyodon spathula TaxID=7913 RepID=UPI001B7F0AB3